MNISTGKGFLFKLSVLSFLLSISAISSSVSAQFTTIPKGSFLISMGETPQTINNGLKPYGLLYDVIKNYRVTVYWYINPGKLKDGVDLVHNGKSYKGGVFIIPEFLITNAVRTTISTWQAQGVVGAYSVSPISLVEAEIIKIRSVPRWTMDKQNGVIAVAYLQNAGIPPSAYGGTNTANWKDPADLGCCDDIFVMPHADPTWATHSNLFYWNLNCKGFIWAACHAPSVLENLLNPANRNEQMNFLTKKDPLYVGTSGDMADDNTLILYNSHNSGSPPYISRFPTDPVSQYIGKVEGATTNGSEKIYIPRQTPGTTARWNPSARVLEYDASQRNVDFPDTIGFTNVAAALVYGRGFEDPARGYVMYIGGHSQDGTQPENIAAMRSMLNLSFLSSSDKSLSADISFLPDTLVSGKSVEFDYVLPDEANPAEYTTEWTSSCGGTFLPNRFTRQVTYIPPAVSQTDTCYIGVTVSDLCERVSTEYKFLVLTANPSWILEKACVNEPATYTTAGESLHFDLALTNTGDVDISNITLTDNKAYQGPDYQYGDDGDNVLEAGETWIYSASSQVAQADIDAGFFTNIATASGVPFGGFLTDVSDTATVIPTWLPAISLTKEVTDGFSYNNVGDQVDYAYTIENTGTVTLPGPFYINDDKIASVPTAFGNLLPGQITTVYATYTINQEDLMVGDVTNIAVANTVFQTLPVISNEAEATVYVDKSDLNIDKNVNNIHPDVGEEVTFTITLSNEGPNPASNVSVVDIIPNGITDIANISEGGILDIGSGTITWSGINFVRPIDLTYTGIVQAPYEGVSFENYAEVSSSDQFDPDSTPNNLSNNEDDDDVLEVLPRVADVYATKLQISEPFDLVIPNGGVATYTPQDTVIAGTNIYYLITVGNLGPDTAFDVFITDDFPVEIENPEYSLDNGGTWTSWTGSFTIPVFPPTPDGIPALFRGFVPASTPVGTFQNSVAAESLITFDPNFENNDSTVVTRVATVADISLNKSVLNAPVVIEGPIDYEIIIENHGPSDGVNVVIEDVIDPAVIQDLEFSTDNGASWNTGWIGFYTYGDLLLGESFAIQIRGTVVNATPNPNVNPIPNTATVFASTPDPNLSNNTESIFTPLNNEADLSIQIGYNTPTCAGDTVFYNITLVNNSNSINSFGAHVGGVYNPTYFNSVQYSIDGGASWLPWNILTDQYDIPDPFLPLDTFRLLIRARLRRGLLPGNISGTIFVESNNTPDPVQSNNNITWTVAVDNCADLRIVKTLVTPPQLVIAGSQAEYLLTVTNLGPSDALQTVVSDTFAEGMVGPFTVATCNTGGSFGPWTGSVNLGTISPGASCIVRIRGTFDINFIGNYTNIGCVMSGSEDPDITNNKDTLVVLVYNPSILLEKTADKTINVGAGETVTYTYTVSNTGNAPMTDISISDEHLGTGILSAISPVSIALLPTGGTVQFTSTYVVTQQDIEDGVSILNTATATAKYLSRSYTSMDTASVDVEDWNPDYTIVKTAVTSTYTTPGDTVRYEITVENTGNVAIGSVVVTDADATGSPEYMSGDTNSDTTLDLSEMWTYTAYRVMDQGDIDAGQFINTAEVTGSSVAGVLGAEQDTALVVAEQLPSLLLEKSIISGSMYQKAGDSIWYEYVLTNTGNVTLTGPFQVVDDRIASISPEAGVLLPGESLSVLAKYTVGVLDLGVDSIVNIAYATVDFGITEVVSNADTAVALYDVADIEVIKTVVTAAEEIVAGDPVEFEISYTNYGPMAAPNVVVTDVFPAGFTGPVTYALCGSTNYVPWTGMVSLGTLTKGDGCALRIRAYIDSTYTGSLQNVACTMSDIYDPDDTNNKDTVIITVLRPSIVLEKSADKTAEVAAGETVTYTYTVSNSGNADMVDVTISDMHEGTGTLSTIMPASIASLPVGGSVQFTSTYMVTQEDIESGIAILNTATATAKYLSRSYTSVDTASVDVEDWNPDYTIVKTSVTSTYTTPGDTVRYEITVGNTGNVAIGSVAVTDADATGSPEYMSGDTNSDTTLDLSEMWTYTAYRVMDQGDIDAGQFINTAEVTGSSVAGVLGAEQDTALVVADQLPSLLLEKSIISGSMYQKAGDSIWYEYVLTNTGNVTLTGPFQVVDDRIASISPEAGVLLPGESLSVLAKYTVGVLDLEVDSIVNIAYATVDFGITEVVSNADTAVALYDVADIEVIKTVVTAAEEIVAGDPVEFEISYTNYGPMAAPNVVVTDVLPAGFTGPVTYALCGSTNYEPWTGMVTLGTLMKGGGCALRIKAYIDSTYIGSLQNVACIMSDIYDPDDTNNKDTVNITVLRPSIVLEKSADKTAEVAAGETLTYTYTVSNSGNADMVDVTISDMHEGTGTLSTIMPASIASLPVGGSVQFTSTYVVTQEDIESGIAILNTATATAKYLSRSYTSVDTASVDVEDWNPDYTIVKTSVTSTYTTPGDTVRYEITVGNTGNVAIGSVAVTDADATGSPEYMSGDTNSDTTLDLSEMWTYTAYRVMDQGDIDAGQFINTAEVTGSSVAGVLGVEQDTALVVADQLPSLLLEKSIMSGSMYQKAGDSIWYEYVLTNTGNVTLTGPFQVVDDRIASISPEAGVLLPGESLSVLAKYTVGVLDLEVDSIVNIAYATVDFGITEVVSNADTAVALYDVADIEVIKTVLTAAEEIVAGDPVEFEISYTNYGPMAAPNVVVTDVLPAGFTGPVTYALCGSTNYEPWTGMVTLGTLTKGDGCALRIRAYIDSTYTGSLQNVACIMSDIYDPDDANNKDTVVIQVLQPAIALVKSADKVTGLSIYEIVTYSYTVTNTGSVTLKNITLTDVHEGRGNLEPIIPVTYDSIQAGQTVVFTAQYALVQEDIDAGLQIRNVATVSGQYLSRMYIASDTLLVEPEVKNPSVEVIKNGIWLDSNDSSYPDIGEQINYTFDVTNTGNVTLTDVLITDALIAVDCGVFDGVLAPGETIQCTGVYDLVQQDLDKGSRDNTAQVTGLDPDGEAVSDQDSVTVILPQNSVIAFASKCSSLSLGTDGQATPGDTILYTYEMTNTGNVTLYDVTVTENDFTGEGNLPEPFFVSADQGSPEGVIKVGEKHVYQAYYRIVQQDIDAGFVNNRARVTANTPISFTPDGEKLSSARKAVVSDLSDSCNPNDPNETGVPSDPFGDDPTYTYIPHDGKIGIAKTVAGIAKLANSNFDVTFRLNIGNPGNLILENLLLTDGVASYLGNAFVAYKSAPVVTSVFGAPELPVIGVTPETIYDGTGGVLHPGDEIEIEFVVEVDPDAEGAPDPMLNQAYITGVPTDGNGQVLENQKAALPATPYVLGEISDLSDSGSEFDGTNPGDPGDTGGEDDPTPVPIPSIDVAKSLFRVEMPASAIPGNRELTFRFRIQNSGNVDLEDIQLNEPIFLELSRIWVGLVSPPVITYSNASSTPTLQIGYDGNTNISVFTGSDGVLKPRELVEVLMRVEVDPNKDPLYRPVLNQATGFGYGLMPGAERELVTDLSDDGYKPQGPNPDYPGDTGGPDDPTPVIVPIISAIKNVQSYQSALSAIPGHFDIVMRIGIKNIGNVALAQVGMSDTISLLKYFGPYFVGMAPGTIPTIVTSTASVTPSVNTAFNGTISQSVILNQDGLLRPGEEVVVQLRVEMDGTVLPKADSLWNRATVWGLAARNNGTLYLDSLSNVISASDVSDAGYNYETTNPDQPEDQETPDDETLFQFLVYIGDRVWDDRNGDGLQTTGEPGIAGTTVRVFNSTGLVATTVTDTQGKYLFDNLPVGEYYLQFTPPAGYLRTVANKPGASLNSDVDNGNGTNTTRYITITGPGTLDLDAGFYRCIQIGDLVWYDINKNDVWNTNENGINNLVVRLWKKEGSSWLVWKTTKTGPKPGSPSDDGFFSFCAPPGEYYVEVVMPPQGLVRVRPGIGTNREIDSDVTNAFGPGTTNSFVVISGQSKTDLGAGFYPMATAGNLVWHDENLNGLQDSGEARVAGVKVEVVDVQTGAKIAETKTDLNGVYTMDYLEKRDVFFRFSPPASFGATYPYMGDDNLDSDVDHTNGLFTTRTISLIPGVKNMSIDMGLAYGVLPVEWVDVRVDKEGVSHFVTWETSRESNVSHYLVERKMEEEPDFKTISPAIPSNSNRSGANIYEFTDTDTDAFGVYIYRIRQVDLDGTATTSRWVKISQNGAHEIQLYPNPAKNSAVVQLDLTDGATVQVLLMEPSGRVVRVVQEAVMQQAGESMYPIDLQQVPAGVYTVLVSVNGIQYQRKLIRIE